jgi:hypothetical protein
VLKVKGILFKALNTLVKENFGNRGEHEVSKRLKKASRDAFEKPVLTHPYLINFYEEALNVISNTFGMDYEDIGRRMFRYIKDMLFDVLEREINSYIDLVMNANKISSYMVDGLKWNVETLEKGRSYLITIKSPYALSPYRAFWKSAKGFSEELLKFYKVENPKISFESVDFNEIKVKLEV